MVLGRNAMLLIWLCAVSLVNVGMCQVDPMGEGFARSNEILTNTFEGLANGDNQKAFLALQDLDPNKVQKVKWVDLDEDSKLLTIEKVKVVLDSPRRNPETNTENFKKLLDLFLQGDGTYVETSLGLHLGMYDVVAEKMGEASLKAFHESCKGSAAVKSAIRELESAITTELEERKAIEEPEKYFQSKGLHAISRAVHGVLKAREENGRYNLQLSESKDGKKQYVPVPNIKREEVVDDPHEVVRKAKEAWDAFEKEKEESRKSGEKRPFPDLEWRTKNIDLMKAVRVAERQLKLWEIRGGAKRQ